MGRGKVKERVGQEGGREGGRGSKGVETEDGRKLSR